MNDRRVEYLIVHVRRHIEMIGSTAHVQRRPLAVGPDVQNGGRGRNAFEPLHGADVDAMLPSVIRTQSAFSSSPTAPTARLRRPSFAVSTTVPPAVPATVKRISSMNSTLPRSGMRVTGRPNTSRM